MIIAKEWEIHTICAQINIPILAWRLESIAHSHEINIFGRTEQI